MARYEVVGPDGSRYEINAPDDATEEQVMTYARQQFAQQTTPQPQQQQQQTSPPPPQASQAPKATSTLGAFVRGVGQGLTANFGDELGAAAAFSDLRDAPLAEWAQRVGKEGPDVYGRTLATIRKDLATSRAEHPVATTVGSIGGGLALGGGLGASGVTLLGKAATIPQAIGLGALEGGAYGAAYGAGEGENGANRLKMAATQGTIGAVTGGVLGGIGQAISRPKSAVPSLEDLRDASRNAYQAAENAGVVVSPQSFGQKVSDIATSVANEGLDPTLHPRVTAALSRLQQASSGQPLSLQQVETLRRVAKNASSSLQPDERRIAQIMVDKLDDYVTNLSPKDVVSGNPSAAATALSDARNLWSRYRKGEIVDDLVERAATRAQQFSGSGYENALRTEFRQLVLNPKRFRLFSPSEQDALRLVAKGGTLENALRMLGKAAPTGIVSSAMGSGAGYAVGGPVGAAAVPMAGLAARRAATALTARNATLAGELMRSGGTLAPVASQPSPIVNALIAGGNAGTSNFLYPEDRPRNALGGP